MSAMWKYFLILGMIGVLSGCSGEDSSTTTSVPDTSVPDTSVPDTSVPDTSVPDTSVPDTSVPDTSVPDSKDTTYKSQFIAAGWDCGPQDEVCYQVSSGTLRTGNVLTNRVTTEPLVTSAAFINTRTNAMGGRFTVVTDCVVNANTSVVDYTCEVIDKEAPSHTSNIGTLHLTLSLTGADQDKDGLPFDTTLNYTAYANESSLPVGLTDGQVVTLRNAYYENYGYACTELGCSKFLTSYKQGDQVRKGDEITLCDALTAQCKQQTVFQWAAAQKEIWSMLSRFEVAYLPRSIESNRYCADELSNKDAIFCLYDVSVVPIENKIQNPYFFYLSLKANNNEPHKLSDFLMAADNHKALDRFSFWKMDSNGGKGLSNDLIDKYFLLDIIPDLPKRPTQIDDESKTLGDNYVGILTDILALPEWGDLESTKLIRSPVCLPYTNTVSIAPNSWMSCTVYVTDSEVYECIKFGGVSGYDCTLIEGQQSANYAAIFKQQMLDLHGFDYAYKNMAISHSKQHPVTVLDRGCDIEHNMIKDRLLDWGFLFAKVKYSTEADVVKDASAWQMHAFDDYKTLSFSLSNDHCTKVASLLTYQGGSYVNMLSFYSGYNAAGAGKLPFVDTNYAQNGIISFSISTDDKMILDSYFNGHPSSLLVNGSGNFNENWSKRDIDVTDASKIVLVGASGFDGKKLADFTATPGSNPFFQNRWIVARGEGMLVASSVANTKNATYIGKGTSFATPIVSRALNVAKNYCPNMSYFELADVMLATADRSMEDYDPSRWGMGFLDVKAMLKKLTADSCQAM